MSSKWYEQIEWPILANLYFSKSSLKLLNRIGLVKLDLKLRVVSQSKKKWFKNFETFYLFFPQTANVKHSVIIELVNKILF